jgi:hypothetical protein
LFGKNVSTYLPEQVSLLEGFIILTALGDPITHLSKGNSMDKLKRIRSMVFLRNNSIFAHGLGPVAQGDYLKFKKFVMELFEEFCRIERINYTEYRSYMEWINPMNSKYYAFGMGDDECR